MWRLLLLAGCGGVDDEASEPTQNVGSPPAEDRDGDGALADSDCDDRDASVHPAAAEVCNGVDDDCDGVIDPPGSEGGTVYYRDDDLDGFGDHDATATLCAAAAGYVASAGDCDDTRAAVNPDAIETCSRFDDDCDGLPNDLDPELEATWYADADRDGFGVSSLWVAAESCTPGPGYATEPDDCDDTDERRTPAAVELCDDGLDSDCTGFDCSLLGAHTTTTVSGRGFAASFVVLSDPAGDRLATVQDGAVLIYAAPLASRPTARIEGFASAELVLAAAGDLDGDGIGDLFVGAPTDGVWAPGVVYAFAGGSTGTLSPRHAISTIVGATAGQRAGTAIAAIGDATGDGDPDYAIAASGVYIVAGPLPAHVPLADTTRRIVVANADADLVLGAVGDADADGRADLVIADPEQSTVWWFGRAPKGRTLLADADATFVGGPSLALGVSFTGPGDVDDDGYDDLVVAAADLDAPHVHRTAIWYGPFSGESSLEQADALIRHDSAETSRPHVVIAAGDLTGGPRADVVLGTPGVGRGAVWVFDGPIYGEIELDRANVQLLADTGAGAGGTLGAGDFDADGTLDLAIGSTGDDLRIVTEW